MISGKNILTFDNHHIAVRTAQCNLDATRLCIGSYRGSVSMWDIPDNLSSLNDQQLSSQTFCSLNVDNTQLTIENIYPDETGNATCTLYSILGEKVFQTICTSRSTIANISTLCRGIYIAELVSCNKKMTQLLLLE